MRSARTWRNLVLSALLALGCLLSVNVLAQLHDHECEGEDCAVCHTLEGVEEGLATVAMVAVVRYVALCAAGAFVADGAWDASGYGIARPPAWPRWLALAAQTPVSLKVRLLI